MRPRNGAHPGQAAQAAKLLMRAYRKMRRPSWAAVARRYGLANKTRAYMIATGRLAPNPKSDGVLLRAILRECDAIRAPRKTLRLIRRVVIPFLMSRQLLCRRRVYGRGGRPVMRGG